MLVKPLLFDRAMNLLHVECKSSIKVRENSLTQQLIFQMNCKVPGQTVRNDLSPSSVDKTPTSLCRQLSENRNNGV